MDEPDWARQLLNTAQTQGRRLAKLSQARRKDILVLVQKKVRLSACAHSKWPGQGGGISAQNGTDTRTNTVVFLPMIRAYFVLLKEINQEKYPELPTMCTWGGTDWVSPPHPPAPYGGWCQCHHQCQRWPWQGLRGAQGLSSEALKSGDEQNSVWCWVIMLSGQVGARCWRTASDVKALVPQCFAWTLLWIKYISNIFKH